MKARAGKTRGATHDGRKGLAASLTHMGHFL